MGDRLKVEWRIDKMPQDALVPRMSESALRVLVVDAEGGWLALLDGCVEKIPVSRRRQHIVRELART